MPFAERQWCIGRADDDVAAHAGSQIDDDVDVGCANAVDDFTIVLDVPCRFARIRVTYVAMHDRSTGARPRRLRYRQSVPAIAGTCGERSWVPPDPVTAQVMKGSQFILSGMAISSFCPDYGGAPFCCMMICAGYLSESAIVRWHCLGCASIPL